LEPVTATITVAASLPFSVLAQLPFHSRRFAKKDENKSNEKKKKGFLPSLATDQDECFVLASHGSLSVFWSGAMDRMNDVIQRWFDGSMDRTSKRKNDESLVTNK
jgi:hypothetical protein